MISVSRGSTLKPSTSLLTDSASGSSTLARACKLESPTLSSPYLLARIDYLRSALRVTRVIDGDTLVLNGDGR